MKSSREVVVGLFMIIGIVVLGVITLYLGEWDLFGDRETYFAVFEQVQSLEVGAPVKVAGFEVGQVSDIEFIGGDYPVRVEMRIDGNAVLYEDCEVRLMTAGVIGDTTINIDAGSPDKKALGPGEQIVGMPGIELEELAGEVSGEVIKTSQEIIRTLEAMNVYLTDPEIRDNSKQILSNLAQVTAKMDRTLEIVNQNFNPMLQKLEQNSDQMYELVAELRGLVGQARGDVARTSQSIESAAAEWGKTATTLTSEIDSIRGDFGALAEKIERTLDSTDEQLNQSGAQLRLALNSLNEMLGEIRAGKGTLGRLLTDPSPFEELSQLIRALNQTLTGSREPTFPRSGGAGGPSP